MSTYSKPIGVDVDPVSLTCCHSSLDQCSANGAVAWMRKRSPGEIDRTRRFDFQTIRRLGFRPAFMYRSLTSSIKSNTRPSEVERSSLMYSACAHIRGVALPVWPPYLSNLRGMSG